MNIYSKTKELCDRFDTSWNEEDQELIDWRQSFSELLIESGSIDDSPDTMIGFCAYVMNTRNIFVNVRLGISSEAKTLFTERVVPIFREESMNEESSKSNVIPHREYFVAKVKEYEHD